MLLRFKRKKYGNDKVELDGYKFDSKKEARYYQELKLLQRGGVVKSFELQVAYILQDGFRHKSCRRQQEAITYVADFVVHYTDGHTEVIDVKGYKTEVYKIKKKLLLYRYPDIDFKEV